MATALALSPTFDGQLPSMSEGIKETLLSAFRQLMRPLVRILLRNGVTYREFSDTAKIIFVDVATSELLPDEEISQEKIALGTGLSLQEISQITDAKKHDSAPHSNLANISSILSGWHTDNDFTGPYGLPLELRFHNEDQPHFTGLV